VFTDSTAFKAVYELLVVDPRVAAAIGQPVALLPGSADGTLRLDGPDERDGHAELTLQLSGPRGVATVEVQAERSAGQWTIATLDLESP
jgi:hypothetical protein